MNIEDYIKTLPTTECDMFVGETDLEKTIPGFKVVSVSGRESLEVDINETDIPHRDGSIFEYKRDATRSINVTYTIVTTKRTTYDDSVDLLKKLLHSPNTEFSFADQPNRYFVGNLETIEVDPAYKMVGSDCYYGGGTIHMRCSDPYIYSKTLKTAKNNGGKTITLNNDGSKSVLIDVKATMKSDNGFLGVVLGDRFYQIGDPGEVDKEENEKSVRLFDDHFTENNGWLLNQGVVVGVTDERLQIGEVTYVVENEEENEGYVKVTDYKTGNSWHGAALTKIVPVDSNSEYPTNWRCEWRFDMNTDGSPNKGIEVGHNSVTFSDEEDHLICAVVFEDNNPVYERSDMAVFIDGNRVWDTRETTNFYVTGRGGNGPVVIVEKLGDQITVSFSHGGIMKTFKTNNPDAELRKITWYCAAYKTYTPITNNNLRALNLTKHKVSYFEDIPNFLAEGDVLEIIGNTNDVYINDVKNEDRIEAGSQPLILDPGTHSLEILVSDVAEVPDVEVTYRERWL